jgi:hypothetical protein
MDKEARADSDVKQDNESAEGFVGEEKSLEDFTKEEPIYLDSKEIVK